MKEHVIEKTVGAPDWTKVSELQVDNVCWLPDAGVRMEQQICHDDEKIYVHQVAREKNIRAELTDKLGSICTDSCMEFFFSARVRQYRRAKPSRRSLFRSRRSVRTCTRRR